MAKMRDCWWWAILWAVATGAMVMGSAAYADTVIGTPIDPLLIYMQAAGFPAWAGIVAWGVIRISAEIKAITNKLEAFVLQTERRLMRLETMLRIELAKECPGRVDKPECIVEKQEQPL